MVPIAIGLNINWVAIGDRFNLYHVMMYLGIMSVPFKRLRSGTDRLVTCWTYPTDTLHVGVCRVSPTCYSCRYLTSYVREPLLLVLQGDILTLTSYSSRNSTSM